MAQRRPPLSLLLLVSGCGGFAPSPVAPPSSEPAREVPPQSGALELPPLDDDVVMARWFAPSAENLDLRAEPGRLAITWAMPRDLPLLAGVRTLAEVRAILVNSSYGLCREHAARALPGASDCVVEVVHHHSMLPWIQTTDTQYSTVAKLVLPLEVVRRRSTLEQVARPRGDLRSDFSEVRISTLRVEPSALDDPLIAMRSMGTIHLGEGGSPLPVAASVAIPAGQE